MTAAGMHNPDDPFDLSRFVSAQEESGVYECALAEIKGGQKRTHWMWFLFPQIEGLGYSPAARRYAIKSIEEAYAYLRHPVLGPRLRECAEAAVQAAAAGGRSALQIFGSPDDLKLKSCATLFAAAEPDPDSVFRRLLARYFDAEPDARTLQRLAILREDKDRA